MKKLKILLVMIMAIMLVGCASTKKAIDENKFEEILKNNGYNVNDVSYSYSYASSAYSVEDEEINVFYLKGKKKKDVENLYIEECSNVYGQISKDYKKEIHGGDNWTSLKIIDNEQLYYVSWVDNTYIYIKALSKIENKVDAIIKELGY